MNKKYFALMAICLFCITIFTSACGAGKNTPPNNSTLYYFLAQQNANHNQEEQNNNQQEENNNQQEENNNQQEDNNNQQDNNQQEENNNQEDNNEQEDGIIEVTLDDDVLQKLGYQKEINYTYRYWIIEGRLKKVETFHYKVKKGEEEITSIEIPSTFTYENKTYRITKIGNKVFTRCPRIESITIPESVTEIEDGVEGIYKNMYNVDDPTTELDERDINEFSEEYRDYLETYCTKVDESYRETPEVFFEKGSYGAFSEIYSYTEENAMREVGITIPNTVAKIGDFAFWHMFPSRYIPIPDGVTTIGKNAFSIDFYIYDYLGIVDPHIIDIPTSVTAIGENAFEYRGINISEEQTTLENYPWGAKKVNGVNL